MVVLGNVHMVILSTGDVKGSIFEFFTQYRWQMYNMYMCA